MSVGFLYEKTVGPLGTAILAFDCYEQTRTGRGERSDETLIGFHGFQQTTHGNGFGVTIGGVQNAAADVAESKAKNIGNTITPCFSTGGEPCSKEAP